MSVRDDPVLFLQQGKSTTGGVGTVLGGNATTSTKAHKLDGPEHTTADDTADLDATVDEHGLMPKLSGDPADVFRGDGSQGPETDPVAVPLVGAHLADTTDAHDASAISIVDSGSYFTGTDVEAALQELGAAGGGSSSLPWFIVTAAAYGALNDNSTDDKAAINLAIAALNTAGKGVLYFPAGAGYICSGALTAITAAAIVIGDGSEASILKCSSATANFLTLSHDASSVRDLGFINTATASAGAAIRATSGTINEYERLLIDDFWVGIRSEAGSGWSIRNCLIENCRKYAVHISNAGSPDAGDWTIADSNFVDGLRSSDAAIYMTSSGGGKIVNVKINSSPTTGFGTGIDVAITTGADTSVLLVDNTSIENIRSGDAIRVTTTGTGQFGSVAIHGCQVGLFSNNAGRAVKLTAASTGGLGTAGGLGHVVIDGSVFRTNGTARAAVELTNTDRVVLGDFALLGFTSRYTSSGDTNTTDSAAGTSFAAPAIVLGTAAAAGAASTAIRSDSTIVAFDATAPTTQALGDAAATGSAAVAARRDHKHAMPALSSATPLVESGSGSVGTALPSSREDHVHPAAAGVTDHFHIVDEQFSGDASTTVFSLANEAVPDSVMAYVSGTRTPVTLGGSMNDQITFGSAPASASLNISVDYAAASS